MKTVTPLRVVIKLGTSSIVDEETHEPMLSTLENIVKTTLDLQKAGHKVIIVSSGAIGIGLRRMKYEKRPKHSSKLQSLAAIGQCRLMSLWDQLFSKYDQPIAQILLTRNDIADRNQYLNAQNTFRELLEIGVIPIVNENDTIAVSEIKFGDNDTLSAITAAMVHANYLFLMTDVDCLYDTNPRINVNARAIEVVDDLSALDVDGMFLSTCNRDNLIAELLLLVVSSAGSSLGTGGMFTKIVAARLATSAGVTTIISRSSTPGNITNIVGYLQSLKSQTPKLDSVMPLHTRFTASECPIKDRHFWILHGLKARGTLYIDPGAYRALENRAGLFAVGVVGVEGNFVQLEAVRVVVVEREAKEKITEKINCCKELENEVGRALVNYSAIEIARIKGFGSSDIEKILGYADSDYVALRENISLFKRRASIKHGAS
ncbi:hypothetical protein EPUL_003246 [Erysiphe pulchra]|uniref:PUA domain-containing protein n=1 Tax=Erysiphe pulchra TaxID=225359 RepID=A0A2S4PRT0_9PEZI|nr:hypothetical protein EPUL_003246 [Erysiphe pulchra]